MGDGASARGSWVPPENTFCSLEVSLEARGGGRKEPPVFPPHGGPAPRSSQLPDETVVGFVLWALGSVRKVGAKQSSLGARTRQDGCAFGRLSHGR